MFDYKSLCGCMVSFSWVSTQKYNLLYHTFNFQRNFQTVSQGGSAILYLISHVLEESSFLHVLVSACFCLLFSLKIGMKRLCQWIGTGLLIEVLSFLMIHSVISSVTAMAPSCLSMVLVEHAKQVLHHRVTFTAWSFISFANVLVRYYYLQIVLGLDYAFEKSLLEFWRRLF